MKNRLGFANTGPENFLSVLVRVRNEPYMEEWCRWYFYQGADHIYIIDDNLEGWEESTWVLNHPNTTVMDAYYDLGTERDKKTGREKGGQKHDYQRVYDLYRPTSEWWCIVDADEYMIPGPSYKDETIRSILETLSKDCIWSPWVMMSPVHRNNPDKLLTSNTERTLLYGNGKTLFRNTISSINTHKPRKCSRSRSEQVHDVSHNTFNDDIEDAKLLTMHYRYYSRQHFKDKLATPFKEYRQARKSLGKEIDVSYTCRAITGECKIMAYRNPHVPFHYVTEYINKHDLDYYR